MENRDSDKQKSELPENKPSVEDTEPGKRLRRLLLSAAEDEAFSNLPQSSFQPEAGQDHGPTQDQSANIEDTRAELGAQIERNIGLEADKAWLKDPLELKQPSQKSEGDVDLSQRHPTGNPEKTGGWYEAGKSQSSPVNPRGTRSDDSSFQATRAVLPSSADAARTKVNPVSQDNGEPLPQRVPEIDRSATRVSPAAYQVPPFHPSPISQKPVLRIAKPNNKPSKSPEPLRIKPPGDPNASKNMWGCILRIIILILFLIVMAAALLASFAVFQYFTLVNSANFPDVHNLKERASQFETTRILDRNGNVLYEVLDPNAGRRTYVTLDKISPYVIAATIATEDKEYYRHPGYDPVAIMRALWQNYTTGEVVSGASTITQQLARTLLISADERYEKTVQRKAREIVLSAEITRLYNKEEILELYLNENYYGNLAYGIEAASETYFHTSSDKLTLTQAAFLAGLPQAPAVYDIFTNREDTLRRHIQVMVLMYELSKQETCIDVSTNIQPVCVSAGDVTQAIEEIKVYNFQAAANNMRYPHWVNYVRYLLENLYDAQTIYRSGFMVYTTLDPTLQDEAERILGDQVKALADRNVNDGALVAIRPSTGEILAMVGSADFSNEAISGQVNMAVSPRQPGSSIKPLTYAAAFEKGWTPGTLIWDVPSQFPPSGDPSDQRPPYEPVNYDERFHGPVTVRSALANSFNIPAVKTLNFVRIYDDPATPVEDGFLAFARRVGITTLTRPDYGLALTLGGGDVSLLDLTGAFAVFANGGRRVQSIAITKIMDYQGNLVYEYQPPVGEQVVRPEHAFLISSILSDNGSRAPMFGQNSLLNLPFQVAAKTGTTNDFRDNWTLGYTPDLAVGVWVGNADYTPMQNTTGLTGAAPIWSQFMQYAIQELTNGNPTPFIKPVGVTEKVICALSGAEPSEWCPSQKTEYFANDQPPQTKENDLWQKVRIDTWTGLLASAACSDYSKEESVLNVDDPSARKWVNETDPGRDWANNNGLNPPVLFKPDRECSVGDPRPNIQFAGISDDQVINSSPLDIYAVVDASEQFKDFRLEYGQGNEPSEWKVLLQGVNQAVKYPDLVYAWFLNDVPPGKVTLRIFLNSTEDRFAEKRVHLDIQLPTPTPTQTPLPTQSPTATNSPLPTDTPTPTMALTP